MGNFSDGMAGMIVKEMGCFLLSGLVIGGGIALLLVWLLRG